MATDTSGAAKLAKKAKSVIGAKRAPSPVDGATIEADGLTYEVTDDGLLVVGAGATATELEIPARVGTHHVRGIRRGAFRDHKKLTRIVLPPTATFIGTEAFSGCTSLVEADLTGDVEIINPRAFAGCTSLRTVYLPFGLRRITAGVFDGCTSLEAVPHFVRTSGPNGPMINRSVVEQSLPTALAHLGEQAFRGCASLRKAVIPFKIDALPVSVFEGCTALEQVWLHADIASIGNRAFAAAPSLRRISVPASTVSVGQGAFDPHTTIVCAEGSEAFEYARRNSLAVSTGGLPGQPIVSQYGATDGTPVADVLASDELTTAVLERYSLRPATDTVDRGDTDAAPTVSQPSRFRFDAGVYRPVEDMEPGDVSIAMTGDLMCGFRQQRSALVDGSYDFSENFAAVAPLLSSADLAVGNLESMFSPSTPYMSEQLYVDDRPHLNAPFEYLEAVRSGGFDVAMNAQNHMYDAGVKGVLETLDALNRAKLIHNGMYASPEDPRHLVFDVRGIRVGFVSFLDPARQLMKQVAFTEEGLAATTSHIRRDLVERDIAAARAAGAEFVIAYAHWGREYTGVASARQREFAQMIVDGGADYVFGSHSHCPQPYTYVTSVDGRRVPVIYSGGNFVADMNRDKPITQDTFVAKLDLTRDADGRVVIKSDGYIPCRIVEGKDEELRGYLRTVPCDALLDGAYGYDPLTAEEDIHRIGSVLGLQYSRLTVDGALAAASEPAADGPEDDLVEAYALREPDFARLANTGASDAEGFASGEDGVWRRKHDTAVQEAVIVCAGAIMYDRAMERMADMGDVHQFRAPFRHVRSALADADLAVANFGALVADMYPPMASMSRELAGGHYGNARPEFLDGLSFAGFDALALAQPFQLDAGVRGVGATERNVLASGLVPSGLGRRKNPVFDVNGIRIGMLSFTLNAYDPRNAITEEGAALLLNALSPRAAEQAIAEARGAGAEFVLAYLDCRSAGEIPELAARRDGARILAEAGADYVVCTHPQRLSRHEAIVTEDGRTVTVATSIGAFFAGPEVSTQRPSALLRLAIRREADGRVAVSDSYVPLKRFEVYHGAQNAIVPGTTAYNPHYTVQDFRGVRSTLGERFGAGIALEEARRVTIGTRFRRQVTPNQIARILGVGLPPALRDALGEKADEPVFNVASRKADLRAGGVAVIAQRKGYQAHLEQMQASDAVDAGALFAISATPQKGLPTLVVEDAPAAYVQIATAIRNEYSPITVGITGTAGKTTSKDLMALAFERHYRTLSVEGNNNTVTTAGLMVQKLDPLDEAFVQEINEGTPGAASTISKMIRPDVVLITNIGDGHLGQMGTIERVITGCMQVADGLQEGGTLVINNDNEHLKAQQPDVRTVRYSIEDESLEYHARRIRSDGERFQFEIVCPDGVFDAELNFQGIHNVSNAVGVFAAAHIAGVPPRTIIAGMSRYVPDSVRQNLVEVGGYRLLIDTYSSTPDSVISAVEALAALPVASGGRRIAIVSDIPDQGDRAEANHVAVGQAIGDMAIDLLLCVGDDARLIVHEARKKGLDAHFFESRAEFNRMVASTSRPGDALLFKGGARVKLLEQTVRPLFGHIV